MNKSSAVASDNLSKAEQRQRKWVNDENIRFKTALAGGTFMDSQPGTVPSWGRQRLGKAAGASRAIQHKHGDAHPTAAQWWPLMWTPDLDQYARPMRCSALAVFDWEL
eukprot:7098425-Pyramimonas_sp.AAC.1